MLGSRDDRKESQTVICSEAEDFATIAPGKLSSEKDVVWFEGRMFVGVLSCACSSEKYWDRTRRALERATNPLERSNLPRDLIIGAAQPSPG
jgi:hypothetical protein